MIYGIGVDLVRVSRIRDGLDRFGERYARRILTENELPDFQRSSRPAYFLAKRFAAKEAAAKAFGTGFRSGLSLRHIGVGHDKLGRPYLECSGRAAQMLEEFGIAASHLSLTDEQDYALAFVTLVRSI